MSLWVVALGVWLITTAAWFAVIYNMSMNWQEKVNVLKAQRFSLEQLLTDCYEGKTDHVWQMRSDGVEVILERGRPDLHRIESDLPEDNTP